MQLSHSCCGTNVQKGETPHLILQEAPNVAIVDLYDSVYNALIKANDELQCGSIAIPAISSGIFGFPLDTCAEVILEAIEGAVTAFKNVTLTDIRIVIIDTYTFAGFQQAFLTKYPSASIPDLVASIDSTKPPQNKLYHTSKGKEAVERKLLEELREKKMDIKEDGKDSMIPCEGCKKEVLFDLYSQHLEFECRAQRRQITCRDCGVKVDEAKIVSNETH